MYVVVQHQFTDPPSAWARVQDALRQQPPGGLKLHQSFPTKDGVRAACLWEAPSVSALQNLLDNAFAGVAKNEYFEVENAEGVGLPSKLLPQQRTANETERNIAVVRSAYAAFLRGDIQGVLATVDEDVDWQPLLGAASYVPMSGKRKGIAETAEFFDLVRRHLRFDSFEPREFIGRGDRVIVLGSYSGGPTAGGKTFTSEWAMAFRLRDGKIIEFREFTDSAAINAAFAS